MSEQKKNFPEVKLWHALVVLLITIAVMASSIMEFDNPLFMGVDEVHGPMFIGVCAAAIMALCIGFKWEDLEKMMLDGIYKALQSILILAIVGILVGVWIDAGVVPTMIYYGLKILSPKIFLVAVVLICSITSLATGTSGGTMASMGVAFLGISYGMGLNPAITTGAILSGAYFGDKMSPLSDTTNLAPAMSGTDVMSHVKFMMLPTGITYAICLVVFLIFGFTGISGAADMSQAAELGDAIGGIFNTNPILILPPVIVIAAFFFLGSQGFAESVLGEGAPGILNDISIFISEHIPMNGPFAVIIEMVIGVITGLDGSGFSGLPLVGSVALTFGNSIGLKTEVLAALGQITTIWVGGGTVIPWGVVPVAAICGISPIELARKNIIPVAAGLAVTGIVAMFLV